MLSRSPQPLDNFAGNIMLHASILCSGLERRQAALEVAKTEFLRRQREVLEVNANQLNCRYLDIGGSLFHTTAGVLQRHPPHFFSIMESNLFPSEADATGYTFIDRDPQWFALLLGFLRDGDGSIHMPKKSASHACVLREARYYGLESLYRPLKSSQHVVVCGWHRSFAGGMWRPQLATYDCNLGVGTWRQTPLSEAAEPWEDIEDIDPITGCVFQDKLWMAIDGTLLHSETLGSLDGPTLGKWTEIKTNGNSDLECGRLRIVGALGHRIVGTRSGCLEELFDFSDESDDDYDIYSLWSFDVVSEAWEWEDFRHSYWYGDDPASCMLDGQLIVAGCSRNRRRHQVYKGVQGYIELFGMWQWDGLPPMHKRRSKAAAVALNGKVVVIGGQGRRGIPLRSVEEYDPTCRRWRLIEPLHTARSGCAAVVVGGCIMVVGGQDFLGIALDSVELYVPWLHEWRPMPSLPMGMARPTTVVIPCE